MGQEVSKALRSRLEHRTLEELLVTDEVIEQLEQHPLPERLHKTLARILASSSKANTLSKELSLLPGGGKLVAKPRDRCVSLWSLEPKDISIPQKSVADFLRNFRMDHSRLSYGLNVLLSPSSHYEYTCSIETARSLSRIEWRFLTTFYHDIVLELGSKTSIAGRGIAYVVDVICQPGEHDRMVVEKTVRKWVDIGRRYRGLIDALGSGSLIVFPEEISDNIWEQHLPLKGSKFDKAIQLLRDIGLAHKCRTEGWNDLGDQIIRTVREPFQFHSVQRPQIQCAAESPPDLPGHGRLLLDSRRLATGRVTKSIQKKTTMRRQTHQQAPPAMNHQYNHSLLPPAVNNQGRGPLADISLYIVNDCLRDTNPPQYNIHMLPTLRSGSVSQEPPPDNHDGVYQIDQGRSTRESVSDISRLGRSGTSTISAILNNDDNTFTTATSTTQGSFQDPADPDITERLLTVNEVPVCIPTTSLTASNEPILSQGSTTEESGPRDVDFSVPQAQDGYQVGASKSNIAEVAEVGKLAGVLGGYLFEGMNKSEMRHREKDEVFVPFTKTVRLHLGYRAGEDFKLEVWLCSSVGRAILQAQMRDLRGMLGDYLFDAMKASIWREREERQGMSDCTGAVDVVFPNGDSGDCMLRVMLAFATGIQVFRSIYSVC